MAQALNMGRNEAKGALARFRIVLLGCLLSLGGCAAIETAGDVVGGVYTVASAPFKVAAWLIPDGDATEAPAPTGTDANPKIGRPYKIKGIWYYPKAEPDYVEVGYSSWYGPQFHGKATANGEKFDMNQLTAAHRTLPLPSYVRVTNLSNGRNVILRVNDRGPFANNRILDVSRRGAQILGFEKKGVQRVRVEVVDHKGRRLPGVDRREASVDPSVRRTANSKFVVQVASFENRNSAKALIDRLEDAIDDLYIERGNASGRTVYRVRVGPFKKESKAKKALRQVRSHGYRQAVVMSAGDD